MKYQIIVVGKKIFTDSQQQPEEIYFPHFIPFFVFFNQVLVFIIDFYKLIGEYPYPIHVFNQVTAFDCFFFSNQFEIL